MFLLVLPRPPLSWSTTSCLFAYYHHPCSSLSISSVLCLSSSALYSISSLSSCPTRVSPTPHYTCFPCPPRVPPHPPCPPVILHGILLVILVVYIVLLFLHGKVMCPCQGPFRGVQEVRYLVLQGNATSSVGFRQGLRCVADSSVGGGKEQRC